MEFSDIQKTIDPINWVDCFFILGIINFLGSDKQRSVQV